MKNSFQRDLPSYLIDSINVQDTRGHVLRMLLSLFFKY